MASVLLNSKRGNGIPLALRMAHEGHIVKACIQDKRAKQLLNGFQNPSLVSAPKMLDQYDLVLYDSCGLGSQADQMKQSGRYVMGGGMFNDNLVSDADYLKKVIEQLLKVDVLEEDKPDLLSISSEGWFNGETFCLFNHSISHNRLMEGSKGPLVKSMGCTVWVSSTDEIIKRAILPLEPLLQKVKYLGPISVDCVCSKTDLYLKRLVPRIRHNTTQASTELMRQDLFDFLWQVVNKEMVKIKSDQSMTVQLSMPPYPYQDVEMLAALKGLQVLDIPKPARRHVMLSDVMKQDGEEVLAGVDGVIGCVTARGSDIQEARRRVYRTVANISIHPDLQYRRDIGLGTDDKVNKLKKWGWIDA